jgi:hypothetical protein
VPTDPNVEKLVLVVTALVSLVALIISILSMRLSRKMHADVTKKDTIAKQYDAFDALAMLRIEHYDMNHLFALPEQYDDRLRKVRASLNATDEKSKASAELREEAVAMMVFGVFEHSFYQYLVAKPESNTDRDAFLREVLDYLTGRLLRNPRLRYYWEPSGGNCCEYFETSTREYYQQRVECKTNAGTESVDCIGPFYERRPTWDINPIAVLSKEDRERYWSNEHVESDYASVWSMTEDPAVQKTVLEELTQINAARILIPGCGSVATLQERIARDVKSADTILCTDFKSVVEIARKRTTSANIFYKAMDSSSIPCDESWDAVVVVNSVLSENHSENVQMIEAFFGALKPGGLLLGFFPTVFCAMDISLAAGHVDLMSNIDSVRSSFYEKKQGMWQIFYTPLRLRKIIKDTGFIRKKFEVFFCDSDYFENHSREYYDLRDVDSHVYEHFIVAEKPDFSA